MKDEREEGAGKWGGSPPVPKLSSHELPNAQYQFTNNLHLEFQRKGVDQTTNPTVSANSKSDLDF